MEITKEEFNAIKEIYKITKNQKPPLRFDDYGTFTSCVLCVAYSKGWTSNVKHAKDCPWLNRMKPFDPLINLIKGEYHD